ncbi:GGDEF domain-containing protein [Solihabitans fulvus]|uniref:GGDEF domain-containing protein n=1 Tax=Solihabitans fulvus TaxID=1892852 RepID=A0A5B2XT44_9PSEU|nr:GGDEF domain-containing protein [Solihabitans fulvus]KAA2266112.1 GGDEF domain-containing protein [Solihabitans fulvus]
MVAGPGGPVDAPGFCPPPRRPEPAARTSPVTASARLARGVLAGLARAGRRSWLAARRPWAWGLWSQRPRVVGYVLTIELLAVVAVTRRMVGALLAHDEDWVRFALLAACATVHLWLSRRQDERQQGAAQGGVQPRIGLASAWTFAGVVVLPAPLMVALILFVRAQRWPPVGRSPYRFAFSTASMLLAAVVARFVLDRTGPHTWAHLDLADSLGQVAIALGAGLVYASTHALLIGVALALSGTSSSTAVLLGTRRDTVLGMTAVALGIVTAALLVSSPALACVMALTAVGAGNYLGQAQELEQAWGHARRDAKTGVLNDLGWAERAERELARARDTGRPVALLMVDADKFKRINDTLGHPVGDAVLRAIGTVLRTATRDRDVVARFGGEEFVVLLPDTGRAGTARVAERIRRTIAELQLPVTDRHGAEVVLKGRQAPVPVDPRGRPLRDVNGNYADAACRVLSVSVGAVVRSGADADLDAMLRNADEAVYAAKDAGRNTVRFKA